MYSHVMSAYDRASLFDHFNLSMLPKNIYFSIRGDNELKNVNTSENATACVSHVVE